MFTQCPNCHSNVSTRTITCPQCSGPLRAAPRDLTGPVFRSTFVLFNLLMVAWTVFYLATGRSTIRPHAISDGLENATVAAGPPLSGNMGLGFLVTLWLLGFVGLGLCALFSMAHRSDARRRPGRA